MRSITDYDSIDDVEADLRKLTEEVRRLRKQQQSSESDNDSWVAISPPEDRAALFGLDKDIESPAQRLMKAHEQQIKGVKSPHINRAQASPAAVHDFPVLASLTNSTRDQARRRGGDASTEKSRKPSYAQILAQKHLEQQTSMDANAALTSVAAHDGGFRFARDDHSNAEDDSDGESSVRRYDIDGAGDELVKRQSKLLQRTLDIQSVSPIQSIGRDGPNLGTEKRVEIRRQRKELPAGWGSVRSPEQKQQQITSRRSHVDLRANTKSADKNVMDHGKQIAATLGSKPSSYAMPTAASKRRAAATGFASPVSPVSHKPARSVPSVKTLWQEREIAPESSDAARSSPIEDLDQRRLVLKTGLGVAHDPAIIDFKEARTHTPDFEAPASPSRLPRPAKRDEHADICTELPPPKKLSARQQMSDSAQDQPIVVETGERTDIMVSAARKFSRAELLAIKAVDDQAKREEIINKISSSEVPDLVAHEKGSADGLETTTSNAPRTSDSHFRTATTQAQPAMERVPDGVGSLRADAPDFVPGPGRPTSKVMFEPGYYNQQDPLWVPDYSWESMSHDQKREVVENRRGRGLSNVSSTDPGTFSTPTPTEVSTPIVLDPQGNVLSPKPKWSWANRRTVKTLRTLGRAPLPTFDSPPTGSGSNSSEGSSPLRAWTVGPDRSGSWYGWRGGDGKEISFRGYGPHAERSPYSPHNFRSYENQSITSLGINNQGHGHFSLGGNIQAPIGLQDWGLQPGYDRVPCPNYQIVRATENITMPENPMGWCSRCLPHRSHVCGNM